jgi:hypothetical protein
LFLGTFFPGSLCSSPNTCFIFWHPHSTLQVNLIPGQLWLCRQSLGYMSLLLKYSLFSVLSCQWQRPCCKPTRNEQKTSLPTCNSHISFHRRVTKLPDNKTHLYHRLQKLYFHCMHLYNARHSWLGLFFHMCVFLACLGR